MPRLSAALAAAAVLALPVASAPAADPAPPQAYDCLRMLRGVDLDTVTIPELQDALAAGRITSADLVDAYEQRIAAYDKAGPKLNAVRQLNPKAPEAAAALDAERAAGKVRGPLHGIPVLLKDNMSTTDQPTSAGSVTLDGAVPTREATVVKRLRDAGAIVLGKLNLSEFAGWVDLMAPAGWSSLGGQVLEPYRLSASPGGSSSGSGVAGAMAFAAGTLGTETSLSILSPSEASSQVGVKTTVGMVSRAGVLPLSPSFDTVGPIVPNAADAAAMLDAVAGPDPDDAATAQAPKAPGFAAALKPGALGLRGAKIAYSESDKGDELFDAALEKLKALGAELVATTEMDGEVEDTAFGLEAQVIPNEFKASLNEYLAAYEPPSVTTRTLDDVVLYATQHSDQYPHGYSLLTASDAQPGVLALGAAQAAPAKAYSQNAIDTMLADTGAVAFVGPGLSHGRVGAAAGYPTVMVPDGYYELGATSGLSFLGGAFSEPKLLAIAADYERATHLRRPPTDINRELALPQCAAGKQLLPQEPRAGAAPPSSPGPAASGRKCLSGKRLEVRGRRVTVNGHRVRVRHGVARIDLTKLRGKRITVRIKRSGRRITRRYRVCR